ncbi:PepSY-associated TM helix domain-containing protein [Sphingobacterium deserti]|nr:PepSY-associated TM helix domain-containing protein [Sphingobacterium deserti]
MHKWLGITSGIVVFIISLTGAVYVFHDELKLQLYPEKYFLTSSSAADPKPLTELVQIAQAALQPDEKITRVDLYPQRDRSWVFRASETNERAFGHWAYFTYYKRVFLDPYAGEVIAIENSKNEFFQLCLQLHMNLLLGKTYGHPLVAYATLIFVILLVSGIVLWWPKKWKGKALKKSLQLDFKVKWKRLNYDLHNVIGFYSFGIALILAVTGLVFSFPNFKKAYVDTFNSVFPTAYTLKTPQQSKSTITAHYSDPLDNALAHLLLHYPDAGMMSIRLHAHDNPSIDIQIRMQEKRSGVFKWYYFRKKDLGIDKIIDSDKLQAGDKLASLNFDVHTGSIAGWGTKMLACLASLFCASLPVTGYILWWHKSRKSKKRNRNVSAITQA